MHLRCGVGGYRECRGWREKTNVCGARKHQARMDTGIDGAALIYFGHVVREER